MVLDISVSKVLDPIHDNAPDSDDYENYWNEYHFQVGQFRYSLQVHLIATIVNSTDLIIKEML